MPPKAIDVRKSKMKVIMEEYEIFMTIHEPGVDYTDMADLGTAFTKLDSYYKSFNELYVEYLNLKNEDGDEDSDNFVSFRKKLVSTHIGLQFHYGKLKSNAERQLDVTIRENEDQRQKVRKVKLPEIKLPEFDGSFNKWLTFRDTFVSLVHTNASFTNIDKFHYLKSSVKIEPVSQNILNNYQVTDETYEHAWEALCSRFDDRRAMLLEYTDALFKVEKIYKTQDILQLVDSYVSIRSSFVKLNVTDQEFVDLMYEKMIRDRLDKFTRREWDLHINTHKPTFNELCTFLEGRHKSVKYTASESSIPASSSKYQQGNKQTRNKILLANNKPVNNLVCLVCSQNHLIGNCPSFLKENIDKRFEIVSNLKLCLNCLKPGHIARKCISSKNCNMCGGKHHQTLHREKTADISQQPAELSSNNSSNKRLMMNNKTLLSSAQTVLSTVKFLITDGDGNWQTVRAVMDSGSNGHVIKEATAKRLGLSLRRIKKEIKGINNAPTDVKYETKAMIKSRYPKYGNFVNNITFDVFPIITDQLPSYHFETKKFEIPNDYFMADPEFNIPDDVDILIGCKVFWDAVLKDRHFLSNNGLLIHTKFGWMFSGDVSCNETSKTTLLSISDCSSLSLEQQLEKFWIVEQCERKEKLLTREEKVCEEIFTNTTVRDEGGRYIVDLSFKPNYIDLGSNLNNAVARFKGLERRFLRDSTYYNEYKKFIDEYESLGHMTEIKNIDTSFNFCYYLPHHGVIKEDSTTTKLRVVFDASCKSETGLSLNDTFLIGPTVQTELYDLIIKFLTKPIAMKADIAKMYRQITVNESHRNYQRIIWRDNPEQEFKHYNLNTVTYGTSCAPYLATRSLIQLAEDYQHEYPNACNLIRSNFYVDDLLFTCDSEEIGMKLREELCEIFEKAGMSLRKWVSNSPEVLDSIPTTHLEKVEESSEIKALGIIWNISTDTFSFKLKFEDKKSLTMSSVLSYIASIYDPIGWLGPIVLTAKLFMKKLWSRQMNWKSTLPDDLCKEWRVFEKSLSLIDEIKIDRQIMCSNPVNVQLHGFCDASISAYGMVLYLRSTDIHGNVSCKIITSKSRVAPQKQITLARLELCAIQLLAKFAKRVSLTLGIPANDVYLWSDSLIALHWVKAEPAKLSVFVGNRVAEIQEESDKFKFHHVRTQNNPADLISRGSTVEELKGCELWWKGPQFLQENIDSWPESLLHFDLNEDEYKKEFRRILLVNQPSLDHMVNYIENRYSHPSKLIKIFASLLKKIDGWKEKADIENNHQAVDYELLGKIKIIKILQFHFFPQEMKNLSKGKEIHASSSIKQLTPFIDNQGIMRTRGRIGESEALSYDNKYQIILPKCQFTYNLIREIHLENLHATKLSTLAFVRQNYWPIQAKSMINKIINRCVKCFKASPKCQGQIMGDLPPDRVNQSNAFEKVAIDYAGPILIKAGKIRNSTAMKSYIALFKCMSTKAIHLELLTDLTTVAFIATFDRFTSRRGLPTDIYSDNATCFEGASNEFKRLTKDLHQQLEDYYNSKNIKWHFITPRAPHMGGYWENGIKQLKHHLKRVMTDRLMTFEEFSTLLCRIEAILNSRPITSISEDPNDFQALTPGHFLIGRALNGRLERDLTNKQTSQLKRWDMIQQAQQLFWKYWYKDIINSQIRPKGSQNNIKYQLNDLVLIKDSNVPSMKWKLGRIIVLHYGRDNKIRNVTIKTSSTELQRHVAYICKLPVEAGEC